MPLARGLLQPFMFPKFRRKRRTIIPAGNRAEVQEKSSRLHKHLRLFLFLAGAIGVFASMYVLYSAVATLRDLDVVEIQRDTWQRPSDVIAALDLQEGSVVADLGSGAGYFTLKLSPIVGPSGKVVAVDLRKLSLSFLWIRAAM